LITTASGKTFAEDCTDFRIRKDVMDKIRWMQDLEYVLVVTNQGGIPQYISRRDFQSKFYSVLYFMNQYLTYDIVLNGVHSKAKYVAGTYCASVDEDDLLRKPNTGMLQKLLREEVLGQDVSFAKSEMLMIGDASGKSGQFSDSDKKTAENFGIDYLDVEDFLKA
jgi:DNA 3'-phosphatase